MQAVRFFKNAREYLTPVLSESAFIEKGMLTPEEFVAAGDHLVHTCPTWAWASCEPSKRKAYLPDDKQYLITNSVPSYRRAVDMYNDRIQELNVDSQMGGDHDEDWCAPSVTQKFDDEEEEEVLVEKEDEGVGLKTGANTDTDTDIERDKSVFRAETGTREGVKEVKASVKAVVDEYEDMNIEDYEDDSLALDDDCVGVGGGGQQPTISGGDDGTRVNSGLVLARRYDVSITYDNYWRTPRVFLFGYDETGSPMAPEKVFEDIMQDYAQKTVTIEPHPHTNRPHASIHPCQHSAAMKRVLEALVEDDKVPSVEQYLFIFLKFLQSVIPTIEYDYTIGVQFRGQDGAGAEMEKK